MRRIVLREFAAMNAWLGKCTLQMRLGARLKDQQVHTRLSGCLHSSRTYRSACTLEVSLTPCICLLGYLSRRSSLDVLLIRYAS